MKTIKFNVQFEVLEGITDGQIHEDLCQVLHEGAVSQVAYVDVGLPEEEPTYNTNVAITEWDNRDPSTTWLWIDKVRYIEVRPYDVMRNMIHNCYNEDVLFLYEQFKTYLDDVVDTIPDVMDDTDTDHIKGFRDHLTNLIESNRSSGS